MTKFEDLNGKILIEIIRNGDDEIIFVVNDGTKYKMYHEQDCCENVSIESINGDLNDLIGTPILLARENSSSEPIVNKLPEKKKEK